MLCILRHPNILYVYGICIRNDVVSLVIELMHGSLFDRIFRRQKSTKRLTAQQKSEICVKILRGIDFLHSKSVVHGDVKLENILLSKDGCSVKLCDFGLARIKRTQGQTLIDGTAGGTTMYMAPEMLQETTASTSNFQTDVWAAGAVIAELYTESNLWDIPSEAKDARKYIRKEMSKKVQPTALVKKKFPDVYGRISNALAYEPQRRPSAREMVAAFSA